MIRIAIEVIRYGSLPLFGLAYRKGLVPDPLWRSLMDGFYAAASSFLFTGEGEIRELYRWFVLACEGLL